MVRRVALLMFVLAVGLIVAAMVASSGEGAEPTTTTHPMTYGECLSEEYPEGLTDANGIGFVTRMEYCQRALQQGGTP